MCPLRPLLRNDTKWEWKDEHDRAFEEKESTIQRITVIQHFKMHNPLRIVCDASKEGLAAVLQQKTDEGWQATHFASRVLTTVEQKNSINELKLLASNGKTNMIEPSKKKKYYTKDYSNTTFQNAQSFKNCV